MRAKIFSRGAQRLEFDDLSARQSVFSDLAKFTSLSRVSIQVSKQLNIASLPKTLRDLSIQGPSSTWLDAEALPEFHQTPANLNFHHLGRCAFDFKHRLPHLRHLNLLAIDFYSRSTRAMTLLVARFIPSGLETLSLSGIQLANPRYWGNLPTHLKILALDEPVGIDFITSVVHHAPHLRFGRLSLYSMDSKSAQLPADAISIVSSRTTEQELRDFVSLFPKTKMPSSNSSDLGNASLGTSRPCLTHIKAITRPEVGEAGNLSESFEWPQSLLELDFRSGFGQLSSLPPKLTRFTASIDHNPGFAIPSSLQHLELHVTSAVRVDSLLEALPSTLTSLTLRGPARWLSSFNRLLPNKLKRFDCSLESDPLSIEFLSTLPPILSSLAFVAKCDSSMASHLPKSITRFTPGIVHYSAPHISDGTFFELKDYGVFQRADDGLMQLRCTSDWDASRTFRYVLLDLPLPPTLTRLSLDCYVIGDFAAATLPSLTRLDLVSLKEEIWQVLSMPSLSYLTIKRSPSLPRDDHPWPTSITHLELRYGARNQWIPIAVYGQLRRLECTGTVRVEDLSLLSSNLEILSMAYPWDNLYDWESYGLHHFPSSLKSLTLTTKMSLWAFEHEIELIQLIDNQPNLTHLSTTELSLDLGKANVAHSTSLLTTLDCAHLSISYPEGYLNDDYGSNLTDRFDLDVYMKAQIARKFPHLNLTQLPRFHIPSLSRLDLSTISNAWTHSALTTVKFGTGVQLWPRFGKLLPSTVTLLDVIEALGVCNATPHYLPRSITTLRIDSTEFPSCSYQQLPSGLTSLVMRTHRFLKRYAKALPSSLQSIVISCNFVGEYALSHCPHSLTAITIEMGWMACLRGPLPPNLRSLCAQFDSSYDFRSLAPALSWQTMPSPQTFFDRDIASYAEST